MKRVYLERALDGGGCYREIWAVFLAAHWHTRLATLARDPLSCLHLLHGHLPPSPQVAISIVQEVDGELGKHVGAEPSVDIDFELEMEVVTAILSTWPSSSKLGVHSLL